MPAAEFPLRKQLQLKPHARQMLPICGGFSPVLARFNRTEPEPVTQPAARLWDIISNTYCLVDLALCGPRHGRKALGEEATAAVRPLVETCLAHLAFGWARLSWHQCAPPQNSMPACAFTPERNGCLTMVISVTRSAASISASGALRPVTITCFISARLANAASTSSSGRYS